MGKPVTPTYSFVTQSVEKVEGDAGTTTAFTFTVTRDSAKGAGTVGYTVTGADADDFVGGQRPSGTIKFARGELTQTVTILVAGDAVAEGNDTFNVALLGSRKALVDLVNGTASGTIIDDETITLLSVDENSAAGIEVADLNNAASYYFKDSVDPLNDGNFKIDATTGVVTTARAFDYEEDGGSLSFIAVSVDSNGGETFSTYEVPIRNVAETRVVDFVGPESNQAVPDGYAGFNWSDGTTAPPTALSFPGVANVFSHGTVVFETPSPLGADSGSNFNLTSLQFSTGGVTGVRITGYENGALKYTSQVIDLNGTDLDHMATAELNWTGIDKVQIDVISGSGVGNVWYMDNIAIGENMGVDFEGVDTVPLVNGFGGLNWDSSNGVLAGLTPDIYGYDTNDFSGGQLFDIAPTNEIAWNAGAGQNTVISAINPADNFTFVSLDLINDQRPLGWGANQLRITGYDGTSATETADITLTESLTTHVFNWEGIDSIHIDVIGGTFQGDQTAISSGFWGMDNLIVV